MLVSPSLLAADFSNLNAEIQKIPNADMLHIDVMDGHFVPNISIGIPIIEAIRTKTDLIFDVHLMIEHPLNYIERFAQAGSDIITIHPECSDDTGKTIDLIHACGKKAGLAIKPNTSIDEVICQGEKLYSVTIMTVEPGFGGQEMITEAMNKIAAIKEKQPHILIEIDGGVNKETAVLCKEKGADILVAGTFVFGSDNPAEEIDYLKAL